MFEFKLSVGRGIGGNGYSNEGVERENWCGLGFGVKPSVALDCVIQEEGSWGDNQPSPLSLAWACNTCEGRRVKVGMIQN